MFDRCFNSPLQPLHTFSGAPSRLRFDKFNPWPGPEHNFELYPFLWLGILGIIVLELYYVVRKRFIHKRLKDTPFSFYPGASLPSLMRPSPTQRHLHRH